VTCGTRQTTKAGQQGCQAGTVFLSDGGKFQSYSAGAFYMAHNSLCSDLPFSNKKINLCLGSNGPTFMCLDENSPKAQISNMQNIITPGTTPIDANAVGHFDARSFSPGVKRHLQ